MESNECEFWRFGHNCSQTCGYCDDNTTCNTEGFCTNGCQYGWRGPRCLQVDDLVPYPLSTLLLSGFLAVSLIMLLFVSLELRRRIKSKSNARISSYEMPGEQLIKKESADRYGTLDKYILETSKKIKDEENGASSRDNNFSSSGYEKPPRLIEPTNLSSSGYEKPPGSGRSSYNDNLSCSGYEKPPRIAETEENRDSSHYTIPNMAYNSVV
ncbi:uncharacterized protein LOC133200089 [Saccostrea echinata]|uniref:uncharacterized protein LOC133200089 n=1 Tax=Saccostrea echinata TaxID=191078 RepID=UPI002A7F300A|nr:uncharacterized protein LOC133200089 [Saccostrea echinata]